MCGWLAGGSPEPTAKADRGLHPGFPSFSVVAGVHGSLAARSAARASFNRVSEVVLMIALYDPEVLLVGWLEPDQHIFDTGMNWAAFISNGHAWSSQTGNWLGPIHGVNCLDRQGRVVAWSPAGPIEGTLAPITPIRAIRAI